MFKMNLKEKYCSDVEKDKEENKDKIVIDDNAFALLEALEELKGMVNLRWSGH